MTIPRLKPHPPAPNSIVLGSITRLSPQQAVVSITVVDGVPLPPGEDFAGVIRVQDIRATEKDKVKVGDCFRGGDVIKGLVVGTRSACPDCCPAYSRTDFPWGCAKLLHNHGAQRPWCDICYERGRFVYSWWYMSVFIAIYCRWNDGAGIMARDAVQQDGEGGEAEVCKA